METKKNFLCVEIGPDQMEWKIHKILETKKTVTTGNLAMYFQRKKQ